MPRDRLAPAVLLALLLAAAPARADTTPPAVPQLIPDTPVFFFTGEPLGSFECRVDAAVWIACTSPYDSGVTGVGDHAFEVRQIDDSGNVGDPALFTWTTAPAEGDELGPEAAPSLDPAKPLDSAGPLAPAGPAATGGGPAPTAQPLPDGTAAPAAARPRVTVRITPHTGYLAIRCALPAAALDRCSVRLGPSSAGAGLTVLTGRSSYGRGSSLATGGAPSTVVYVRLSRLGWSLLRARGRLPVLARVTARPLGGGRAAVTEREAVLRY